MPGKLLCLMLVCLFCAGCGDFEWFPSDNEPAPFSFATKNNVELNTTVESDPVTITGLTSPVPISVAFGEYSLDGGATYTSASGTVSNGQSVKVRHTSALTYSTNAVTDLTVANVTGTFTSVTKATPTPIQAGKVAKAYRYPAGINWIGDVVFVGTTSPPSLWALAGSDSNTITGFIEIDLTSGNLMRTSPPPTGGFIASDSQLAFDGQYFWVTSSPTTGTPNGIPQPLMYQFSGLTGQILATASCPASSVGGFCQGLAWDGSAFWSGAFTGYLYRFAASGLILSTVPNITSVSDLTFDVNHNQLLILLTNGQLFALSTATGSIGTFPFTMTDLKGDWDGSLFWSANNSNKQIEGTYLGY